ncbi:bis(5'-nucleosyl)-tetraphosphatase (symmetrical) YqeK [Bacillus andreraoultii]|uniref:bis(5'-nucleosyl)-tetraphosphatase (symmetrical) YqeK n=1 Tax=Bacillus andreraoultii TaxID=1499685 RepID=UPI00053AF210|nr:bis(5'-nucleosyl)-tetraphosphatase (symmetrical) YqeK [Bacillus andreraoultii]
MERDEALAIVKQHLPEKRYIHTIGVMETAIELAKKYGCDERKAELAGIFHDYAKYRPVEEMRQVIIKERMPQELLKFHSELWHGPVGAFLVKKEVGISDEEILHAIRYHTTGRPNMTVLEKVVFLADYIEPGRKFPGVEEVRVMAQTSLDDAVFRALQNIIIFLTSQKSAIYKDTIDTYNSFLLKTR